MLYVKFKKDYPQTGNKAGDVIRLGGKVPPHLREYVSESSEGAYKSYEKKQSGLTQEGEEGDVSDAEAQAAAELETSELSGDPLAAMETEPPPTVKDTGSVERNQVENERFNPEEISKPATGRLNDPADSKKNEPRKKGK